MALTIGYQWHILLVTNAEGENVVEKIGQTRKISLTLNDLLWERIDEYCELSGASMSSVIREAVYSDQFQHELLKAIVKSRKTGDQNAE